MNALRPHVQRFLKQNFPPEPSPPKPAEPVAAAADSTAANPISPSIPRPTGKLSPETLRQQDAILRAKTAQIYSAWLKENPPPEKSMRFPTNAEAT